MQAIYKGCAVQDGLMYIELPDEIYDGTKRVKRTFPSKMQERIRI